MRQLVTELELDEGGIGRDGGGLEEVTTRSRRMGWPDAIATRR